MTAFAVCYLRDAGAYEHHEPTLARSRWHPDWLWRLVKTSRRKKEFEEANRSNSYDPKSTRVADSPVVLASNYVIFEPEGKGTWIASQPQIIAEAPANGASEVWRVTPLARALHTILLSPGRASRSKLRTTNPQRAHPQLRLSLNNSKLRDELEDLVHQHRIGSQNDRHRRNVRSWSMRRREAPSLLKRCWCCSWLKAETVVRRRAGLDASTGKKGLSSRAE